MLGVVSIPQHTASGEMSLTVTTAGTPRAAAVEQVANTQVSTSNRRRRLAPASIPTVHPTAPPHDQQPSVTRPSARHHPQPLDRHRTTDDRAVEALLASVHEPCTAHQLACGLRWTLERTIDALRRLEANLANTGQTVEHLGHHTYALGPDHGSSPTRKSPAACDTTASRLTSQP